jgi:hypothetical protein
MPELEAVPTEKQMSESEESEQIPEPLKEQVVALDDTEDTQTVSTAVTAKESFQKNRFALFEKLLSFLDTSETLNPVLSGYFFKLFSVLLASKQHEVFGYIYQNLHVLDNFLNHLYSKSVSDVLKSLLTCSDVSAQDSLEIASIRQSFVFKILQRMAPQMDIEDHINA